MSGEILKIIDVLTGELVNEFPLESSVTHGYTSIGMVKDGVQRYLPTKDSKEDSRITVNFSNIDKSTIQHLVHQMHAVDTIVYTGTNLSELQIYCRADKESSDAGISVARILIYDSENKLINSDCDITQKFYGYGSSLGNMQNVLRPRALLKSITFRWPYTAYNCSWACLSYGSDRGTKHTASLFVRPKSGKVVKMKRVEVVFGTAIYPRTTDQLGVLIYINGTKKYEWNIGHHAHGSATPPPFKANY